MATQVIPMAPQTEQPNPNMFANWGANPVGNWNRVMDKKSTPAGQFVTGQMQQMNIPDPNAPQQKPVVPYAPEQTVVQPQQKEKPVVMPKPNGTTVVNPQDPNAGMEALLYTSPEQEERMRKASVQRQRIMAIGDALRHIGNIYNTVNYAPSQQFNNPVEEERKRYLTEKAYRDQNNYKYMTYQQAKAAQEAKMRQWETDFKYKIAKDARDFELRKNESEARQQRQNALAELDKARLEGQLDKNTYQRLVNQYYPEQAQARINEIESRIEKNARTGGGRGSRGGSGSTARDFDTTITYEPNEYDSNGKLVRRGKQHTSRRYTNRTTGSNVSGFSIRGGKDSNANTGSNISKFSIHK